MANPQLENGYLRIANEVAERFAKYRISGEEWQILWVVIMKTLGWNKEMDEISLSQFSCLTGIKRSNAIRALNKLVSKKILRSLKNETTSLNQYGFNRDYEQWMVVSKKRPGLKKETIGSLKNDNGVVSKKRHTKDTNTKDTIKNIYSQDVQKVLDYLNQKTGRKFRNPCDLKTRFEEGYTVDDAMMVIDNKFQDREFMALDNVNGKYMRPETLFCKKHFDSYLNQGKSNIPILQEEIFHAPDEEETAPVELPSFLDEIKEARNGKKKT